MRLTPIVVLLAAGLGCQSDVEKGRAVPASVAAAPVSRAATTTATTTTTARVRSTSLIGAIVAREPAARLLEIIAAGADVNDRGGARSTALYFAAGSPEYYRQPMLPVVRAMVERGADVKARCIGGFTALHSACERGSPDVVAYLISKGADANAKDDSGITPMHMAAGREDLSVDREDQMTIIRFLVTHGAELNAVDDHGETPRDWAARAVWDASADVLIGELGGKYHAGR